MSNPRWDLEWQWLEDILDGIDQDQMDADDGWWETTTGALFGADKLAELKAAILERYGHP